MSAGASNKDQEDFVGATLLEQKFTVHMALLQGQRHHMTWEGHVPPSQKCGGYGSTRIVISACNTIPRSRVLDSQLLCEHKQTTIHKQIHYNRKNTKSQVWSPLTTSSLEMD